MQLLERFLKYVAFDTQSDPRATSYPSTTKQLVLLRELADEMRALGLQDVKTDAHGYTTGTIPATPGCENATVIGFIAHVDTSPDMSGADVRPQVIENYDGGDIPLGTHEVMRVADFPELAHFKGHTLITTDGTTLLGADDKAGVAEIMTAAQYLMSHLEVKHGAVRLAFTPDEEVGRGAEFFDVGRFGAKFAYTVDGGFEGELEYENFNAAGAVVRIRGRNIHPGYAKGKMLNALQLMQEFDAALPAGERPQSTEGYEGFYHLTDACGTVEGATMEYIIRDHSAELFEKRKATMRAVADGMNARYGEGTITLELKDQYYNMRSMVEPHPEVIEKALEAMRMAGVEPIVRPIRGGTDGAQLSYKGLPCPNIFTGGMNFHGRYEYCSLDSMRKAVRIIVNLASLWAE